MSESVTLAGRGGLITLSAADALWVGLTNGGAVPIVCAAFAHFPADAGAGYVLLGGCVVGTVRAHGGPWGVLESEVRQAAAEVNMVAMDCRDLVRIGPFGGTPKQNQNNAAPLRWRQRIARELQEKSDAERAASSEDGRLHHLAGIDWRRAFVEEARHRTARAWWLPRAVVRLLDLAEHAETRWLQAARTDQKTTATTGRCEPPAVGRRRASTALPPCRASTTEN
ncbi:hypothetical protein AB0H69_43495 [Streptomyces phaeochromogenes]|uniref:hypothetical protein n=1 Tax=Streptomyces phaeochromogenes TaxID=1923 RepID=UPI003407A3F6